MIVDSRNGLPTDGKIKMDSNILNEKYSVLMSVYEKDDPSFLTMAIESMLNQTVPPEQFVIVEDGIAC